MKTQHTCSFFLLFFLCLFLLCLFSTAHAQHMTDDSSSFRAYIRKTKNGSVNWKSGMITATGISTARQTTENAARKHAMAVRAATVAARRNLLETIKTIPLGAGRTVTNAMQTSRTIQSRIHGLLQNCQILSRTYQNNGTAQVKVALSLYGSLSDILLPDATQFGTMPFASAVSTPGTAASATNIPVTGKPKTSAIKEQDLSEKHAQNSHAAALQQPAGTSRSPDQNQNTQDTAIILPPSSSDPAAALYTGLIVDARRIPAINPALSPQIVDEQGALVYGAALLVRQHIVESGMAHYVTEPAWSSDYPALIATNPFTARATTVTGTERTTLVISQQQAQQIRALTESKQFLSQARVVIVIDPPAR